MNITALETLFDKINGEILPIADFMLDAGTQQRAKTDKNAIDGYTESMKQNGVESWEPVQLIKLTHSHTMENGVECEAGCLILVNGFQRIDAAVGANYDKFPAKVCEGTFEEAVYYSMIANKRNGVSLKGADYQKAIKKLYILDAQWREHGKKKELALLFGCSTKTVERAVKVIDSEVKAQAFKMFEQGADDKAVMEFSHKTINTVKAWREEYNQAVEDKATATEETERKEQAEQAASTDTDFLDMTLGDALKITDKTIQATILAILNNHYSKPEPKADEPKDEPKAQGVDADDSPDTPEGDDNDPMHLLATKWFLLDAYGIHNTTKEKVDTYVNKKAQLNRLHKLALKQCHPDKFGKDNEALAILMNAFAELKKTYNIK